MVEGEPGCRGQGQKRRKSAETLLSGKEKVMKNIQPRSQRPEEAPEKSSGKEAP